MFSTYWCLSVQIVLFGIDIRDSHGESFCIDQYSREEVRKRFFAIGDTILVFHILCIISSEEDLISYAFYLCYSSRIHSSSCGDPPKFFFYETLFLSFRESLYFFHLFLENLKTSCFRDKVLLCKCNLRLGCRSIDRNEITGISREGDITYFSL
jgi:hypothetical protein